MHESFGCVLVYVAEASEDASSPQVRKITSAIHGGTTVTPLGVEAQVQSAVAFGRSAALTGAITREGGRIEKNSFHDYPVLRLHEMPVIDVRIVLSTYALTGAGEPATPPVAPAVANAFGALTGKRLRVLPFAA